MSLYRNLNLGTTGVNAVNQGARVTGYTVGNSSAADAWVKFFDKATAPVVGTDTPVWTQYVPKGTVGFFKPLDLTFANGIGVGATGAAADADTTAPTANSVIISFSYRLGG